MAKFNKSRGRGKKIKKTRQLTLFDTSPLPTDKKAKKKRGGFRLRDARGRFMSMDSFAKKGLSVRAGLGTISFYVRSALNPYTGVDANYYSAILEKSDDYKWFTPSIRRLSSKYKGSFEDVRISNQEVIQAMLGSFADCQYEDEYMSMSELFKDESDKLMTKFRSSLEDVARTIHFDFMHYIYEEFEPPAHRTATNQPFIDTGTFIDNIVVKIDYKDEGFEFTTTYDRLRGSSKGNPQGIKTELIRYKDFTIGMGNDGSLDLLGV